MEMMKRRIKERDYKQTTDSCDVDDNYEAVVCDSLCFWKLTDSTVGMRYFYCLFNVPK